MIVTLVIALAAAAWLMTRQSAFHVRRTTTIHAEPERIRRLIENVYVWPAWSPYERRDPRLQRRYSGARRGPGAIYAWDGNRMEILDASPTDVMVKLDFVTPFQGQNVAEFNLEPKGDSTNLTWTMHGRHRGLTNMDRLIGRDFETALRNLKAIAEN